MPEGVTIEYIGPFRPPWRDAGPLKIVTYFDELVEKVNPLLE